MAFSIERSQNSLTLYRQNSLERLRYKLGRAFQSCGALSDTRALLAIRCKNAHYVQGKCDDGCPLEGRKMCYRLPRAIMLKVASPT